MLVFNILRSKLGQEMIFCHIWLVHVTVITESLIQNHKLQTHRLNEKASWSVTSWANNFLTGWLTGSLRYLWPVLKTNDVSGRRDRVTRLVVTDVHKTAQLWPQSTGESVSEVHLDDWSVWGRSGGDITHYLSSLNIVMVTTIIIIMSAPGHTQIILKYRILLTFIVSLRSFCFLLLHAGKINAPLAPVISVLEQFKGVWVTLNWG